MTQLHSKVMSDVPVEADWLKQGELAYHKAGRQAAEIFLEHRAGELHSLEKNQMLSILSTVLLQLPEEAYKDPQAQATASRTF